MSQRENVVSVTNDADSGQLTAVGSGVDAGETGESSGQVADQAREWEAQEDRAVEDAGETRNTMVIFTSDHGEGCGHHQMTLKNYLYQEAVNVPLMVAWPGQTAAGSHDTGHLVSGVDILPTF